MDERGGEGVKGGEGGKGGHRKYINLVLIKK